MIFPNCPFELQVGLQEALAYAKSLAKYAANLGPVAWKMASMKIEAVLPAGVRYGPGWVSDNVAPLQPLPFPVEKQKPTNITAGDSSKPTPPLAPDLSPAVAHEHSSSWRTPFPAQQNNPAYHHPYRNGFGDPSLDRSSVMNIVAPDHAMLAGSRNNLQPDCQGSKVGKASEAETFSSYADSIRQGQKRHSTPSVPPDLNVRVPASSPTSSGLQIGSPQQPDLALQL